MDEDVHILHEKKDTTLTQITVCIVGVVLVAWTVFMFAFC